MHRWNAVHRARSARCGCRDETTAKTCEPEGDDLQDIWGKREGQEGYGYSSSDVAQLTKERTEQMGRGLAILLLALFMMKPARMVQQLPCPRANTLINAMGRNIGLRTNIGRMSRSSFQDEAIGLLSCTEIEVCHISTPNPARPAIAGPSGTSTAHSQSPLIKNS